MRKGIGEAINAQCGASSMNASDVDWLRVAIYLRVTIYIYEETIFLLELCMLVHAMKCSYWKKI